ncbi:putative glycosyltransferase family 49 protein, partial [Pseudohyphozyma bogoriensis]
MTARRPSLSAAIASPETITAFAHNFGPVQPSTPPASSGTSTTPSSPATRSSKEVGLGLMLDEDANGAHPQPPSIGAASARAREMMTRLGLDEDIEQAPVAPEWASFDRPGSNQSRNSAVSVPRLSTTGGSSPLLVYTGTPLLSASSSPYVPQTSHPSHRAPSPSLYASGMERSSSLQSQRSSGDHSRHQSLTSACPPVTSSVSPSPNPEYPSSPSQREREKGGWKASAYDWGSSNTPSSKDDPRNGGKSHHLAAHATNPLWTIVNLPSALLAFFLSPLSSSHHSSPALSNSTSPSVSKRWPFPLRLLTISYLIFSCLFFGIKITSSGKELRPNPNMKISPRGVEGDMLEMGVGRGDLANEDAKNFVLGRMGGNVGGWAQKVADGVRWGVQGAGQQAKAVRSKPEEWGLVKRVTPGQVVLKPDENPLTSLTHTYRFAKMHDKIHWDLPDEIEP